VSQETRVVYISIPREDASNFARELVDMRLAACVNIIPKMESFYRWEGKTLADSEALLIVKTSLARMTELQAHVIELAKLGGGCEGVALSKGLDQ